MVCVAALLAKSTGSRHHVLVTDGSEDIIRFQPILRHHIRLHPYTQGIGVSQQLHRADTRHTQETRFDVDVDIVGNEVHVEFPVTADERSDLQDIILPFLDLYAHSGHLLRK